MLTFIDDDKSTQSLPLRQESFVLNKPQPLVISPTTCKLQQAKTFLQAYFNDQKLILLDAYNKQTLQQAKKLDKHALARLDFFTMLYTSGSSGRATGVFKNKTHLDKEVASLLALFAEKKIKKVIVTVPFIHIYGILFGLLLPRALRARIVLKQHFLPHDLLRLVDKHTMVVTTPLYIKSLLQLQEDHEIAGATFVSSTAPLGGQSAKAFTKRFKANLYQVFGSTETGGIAYKQDDEVLWTPFEGVEVSRNEKGLLEVNSPFVSQNIYKEGIREVAKPFKTFDYIQMHGAKFQLVGRDSKIIKIAGKRYSTEDIEYILESLEGITRVLVQTTQDTDTLRGEKLQIFIEGKVRYTKRQIKKVIKNSLSNIQFSLDIVYVDKIPLTQTGKKMVLKDA
ncbi:MAG: AMP-binding protein [Campylobacterota bacterium]